MTVVLTSPRLSFAGDGSTTQFSTPFFVVDNDLQVVLRKADNSTDQWTLGTEYTLSGAGNENGGTLTVETAPTDFTPQSGETLIITTSPPLTQNTDYPIGGPFPALAHESALDKLTLITQHLSGLFDRTFLVPVADSLVGSLPVLPLDADRANSALGFDVNGNPIAIPVPGTNTAQDLFAGDGSQTVFTLSVEPASEASTFVFVDGVRQQTDTYTLSGTTLTFSEAPPGDGVQQNIEVVHTREVEFGAPADGSLTAAKLSSDEDDLQAIVKKLDDATQVFNVKWGFGAVGDGVTDDSAAFQAAIDAAAPRGATVVVPPAHYVIGSDISLANGVKLEGVYGQTSLLGSRLQLTNNSKIDMGGLSGAVLSHLRIDSNSTTVPAVDFTNTTDGASYCDIVKCNIVGGKQCVTFHNCLEIRVNRCRFVTIAGSTNAVNFDGRDGGQGDDSGIDAVEFVQCVFGSQAESTADVIDANGDVASCKFTECVVLFGARGLVLRQSGGTTTREPRFFYFTAGGFENCNDATVDIAAGSMIKFTNFYVSNDAPAGVLGDNMRLGSGGDVIISGGEVRGAARDGIRVFNGTNATITGCHIGNNGRVETGHGVTITEAGKVVVVGNNIGAFADGTNNQVRGVDLVSQVTPVTVVGNDLGDNTGVGLLGTIPAGSIVRDNRGYVTENWGVVTDTPNANGNITIAHGLADAPGYANAQVRGDSPAAADVESVTATNIIIRMKNTTNNADLTTGNRVVYWHARI